MSTIRLEHDKFNAASMLAELLKDRLLSVGEAEGETCGEMKSTTYVCSAAFEVSIGGQDAAIARGRAAPHVLRVLAPPISTCVSGPRHV